MVLLESTDRKIVDVRRVLRILQVAPWQRSMLESNRGNSQVFLTSLDRCLIELESRTLMGVGGADWDVPPRIDSPFWKVVKYAKDSLELCMTCLQMNGTPDMVNDPQAEFAVAIPGADGQVHAVFPLVTLIFATFDIPVPPAGSALWNAQTIAANQANPRVSIYACLDLAARTPWYTANAGNKDKYHLKENLRQGIFDTPELRPQAVAQLLPWADGGGYGDFTLLTNLVGAVKRMQADYVAPTAWDPLADVGTHCRFVLADLLEKRAALRQRILQQTVESVTRPPPLTELERAEMQALVASHWDR
jgi:hypothetical protein